MRKNKGFTLVELLVVMAIISILAAIAIPNVQKWIRRGRATQAISEIRNIELSITKMLSDAGRSSITDFIDRDVFNQIVAEQAVPPLPIDSDIRDWGPDEFQLAIDLYTNTMYALLRAGRGALVTDNRSTAAAPGVMMLKEEVVRLLGTSYMTDLAKDPWNNLYQMYPGPWSTANGAVPFRTYLPPADSERLPGSPVEDVDGDKLSLGSASPSMFGLIDPATDENIPLVGVPATKGTDVFIWSKGENLISGQALFYHPDVQAYDEANNIANYEGGQEPEFMGGGDDINNWDRGQTFMQFYN